MSVLVKNLGVLVIKDCINYHLIIVVIKVVEIREILLFQIVMKAYMK